jgi:hypothetical protein
MKNQASVTLVAALISLIAPLELKRNIKQKHIFSN